MRKEIYLVKGIAKESYDEFSNRIISLSKAISENKNVNSLKVTLTEESPAKISVIPFKKGKIAAISLYSDESGIQDKIVNEPGFSGGYNVEEAIPVAYEKYWYEMQKTPGVCLLTLFQKKKGINWDTFLDRWHNSHTPLSLKIHPLWNYNRNVVNEKITDDSYDWNGIVEEHFRTTSDSLKNFMVPEYSSASPAKDEDEHKCK